jgi:phosphatidylglycerol:prolipoprotein diacylglycerol transferase
MIHATILSFPAIDPIAFQWGFIVVRWYALAYMVGILGGWWYVGWLDKRSPMPLLTRKQYDDMMLWGVLGVVLGGRLGYVLFYNLPYFLEHPADILKMWQGGMSFHGGALGVIGGFYIFARLHTLPYKALMDRICPAVPIGLFLGRLANFINGELYGRVTDSSFGMVFPQGGALPRHPSQLYEAMLEGLVLFAVLWWLAVRHGKLRIEDGGFISGAFLAGYGLARFMVEYVREPDAHIGLFLGFITRGQILCIPMVVIGVWLMWRVHSK